MTQSIENQGYLTPPLEGIKVRPYKVSETLPVTKELQTALDSSNEIIDGNGNFRGSGDPGFNSERALIASNQTELVRLVLKTMGLEEAPAKQVHADGKEIGPQSKNVRIGWEKPDTELIKYDRMGTMIDPESFEKSEISHRANYIKSETVRIMNQVQGHGVMITPEVVTSVYARVLSEMPVLYRKEPAPTRVPQPEYRSFASSSGK